MARKLRPRKGTTLQNNAYTGALAEVTIDTTKNTIVIHDGTTTGGHPLPTTADISEAKDVLSFANLAAFPVSGSGATLYIAADTGLLYWWNGAAYVSMGLSAIPTMTMLGNNTGGTAVPTALTKAQIQTALDIGWVLQARNTTAPNATIPAHQLQATGGETNIDIVLSPKGNGSLLANPPDSTIVGGNKRGIRAVDWQQERDAATQVASGGYSVIGGGLRNTAPAPGSVVVGGDKNNITDATSNCSVIVGGGGNIVGGASSTCCFIGGGLFNSAQGSYVTVSGGNNNEALAMYATISGGTANKIYAGNYTTIGGGNNNQVSDTNATIAGGVSNQANSNCATVAGGGWNLASSTYATVVGGENNTASGTHAVAGGNANTVSGGYSVCFGQSNFASGLHNAVFGAYANSYLLNGALVHSSGPVTTAGDLQTRNVILAARTTNATPALLSVSAAAASQSTQLVIQNHTIQAIRGRCVARIPGSSVNYAVWEFTAYVKKDATVASVALLGAVSPTLVYSAGTGSAWTLAIGVDAVTLGALTVIGTGGAGETIVWGCSLEVLEVQDIS